MEAGMQFIEVEKQGQDTVVKIIHGLLDGPMAKFVSGQLSRVVDESTEPKVRLDLGNVSFLTAAAMGELVALHSELEGRGGELVLYNVRLPIYEVFKAVHLNELFDIQHVPCPC